MRDVEWPSSGSLANWYSPPERIDAITAKKYWQYIGDFIYDPTSRVQTFKLGMFDVTVSIVVDFSNCTSASDIHAKIQAVVDEIDKRGGVISLQAIPMESEPLQNHLLLLRPLTGWDFYLVFNHAHLHLSTSAH